MTKENFETRLNKILEELWGRKITPEIAIGHCRHLIAERQDDLLAISRRNSVPSRQAVEQYFTGEPEVKRSYWQEAPYRTNGDVFEDIYSALEHFITNK